MSKKRLIALFPIMLAFTLTSCSSGQGNVAPTPTVSATPPAPIAETTSSVPVVETPPVEPTSPTDTELADVVKSYNQEVDASNDKAKDILENYTGQIESVTGK